MLQSSLFSAAYVAYDQWHNNPEPSVMRAGFVLVTLYMGPLGLLLYVLADKEPHPGAHEEFVRPLWKQGVGSTIHCVAGDATGIILAAVITATLGLPMWVDLIVEYVAGFGFGLFIFQSLFMKTIMGGTYWENVRRSFLPEFISMNCMMAGMAPVMAFLMMSRDMRAMDPAALLFWGVMSLGVVAGFALAYPVNVWMVAKQLKHGLMTERKSGSRFEMDAGKKSPHKKSASVHAGHEQMKMDKAPEKKKQPAGDEMKSDVTWPQPDNRRYERWHVNFRDCSCHFSRNRFDGAQIYQKDCERVVSECVDSMLHEPMYATTPCYGKFASLSQREIGTAISKQTVRYALKPRAGMLRTYCSKRNSFLVGTMSQFSLGLSSFT